MGDVRQTIIDRLADGESLLAICSTEGLPCARTIQRWQNEDDEFDVAVMRARENGFLIRAEKAVKAAKDAEDAAKGRLALDAERWFLGKLSNAFSDDKTRKIETKSEVTHRYDLDNLSADALDDLERILADASAGEGSESPPPPDRLH